MLDNFIKRNKYFLIIMFILLIVFIILKVFLSDYILKVDIAFMNFVSNKIVNDKITPIIKVLTHLGSALFLISLVVLSLIFIKDKNYFINLSLNLSVVYVFSVIYKNFIKRERPISSLIPKPKDYSFPSGHTMCSVAFYGFLIYLTNRYIKNKTIKIVFNVINSFIIFVVAFSRLYLGVHYLSDVICGFFLGLLSLFMYINYVKKEDII